MTNLTDLLKDFAADVIYRAKYEPEKPELFQSKPVVINLTEEEEKVVAELVEEYRDIIIKKLIG